MDWGRKMGVINAQTDVSIEVLTDLENSEKWADQQDNLVKKWADQLDNLVKKWADHLDNLVKKWADQQNDLVENWADQQDNLVKKWADQQDNLVENWADQRDNLLIEMIADQQDKMIYSWCLFCITEKQTWIWFETRLRATVAEPWLAGSDHVFLHPTSHVPSG